MADEIDALRQRWNHLYRDHLPALAKARDPVQEKWPVDLDHCFARIILDNAVGKDRPWAGVVQQPAVKNMSRSQLEAAIKLGEEIATGQQGIVALNERSLGLRGNKKRKGTTSQQSNGTSPKRRKNDDAAAAAVISSYFLTSPPEQDEQHANPPAAGSQNESTATPEDGEDSVDVQLKRIACADITPFRKLTLSLLCQVPRGRYSTYQAMADHITRKSHKTCARAVGNAMRNNPFAPEVPCHRILAADGSLGGFKGHWGEEGKYANLKHQLLHEEGVRFDSKGKVRGPPFRGFTIS